MKRITLILAVFLTGLFFVESCKKDSFRPSWDTELFGPILKTSLGVNNLVSDTLIQENPDSSLKLVYDGDLYNMTADTLIQVPDTTLSSSYHIPAVYYFGPGQYVISPKTDEVTYDLGSVKLTKAILKSENIHLYIRNRVKDPVDFTYKIPCATLNGVPFEIHATLPAATTTSFGQFDSTCDLSGYVVDLTGQYHNKYNTVTTYVDAKISANGVPITVYPTDSFNVLNSATNVKVYYAKGYFGQDTVAVGPETSVFPMFNKVVGGSINLKNVNVSLSVENGFGVDAQIYINKLSSFNSRTNNNIDLVNNIIDQKLNINGATDNNGWGPIVPSVKTFVLDTSNSNIKSFIENMPDEITYGLKAYLNPLGNISAGSNFLYDTKGIKVGLKMTMPLSLVANQLTLADTVGINLSSTDVSNLKDGTLHLYSDNGFPFTANVQLYLLNKYNVITDSLFITSHTIAPAPVDGNYKVTGPVMTELDIPMSSNKLNLLVNTKNIIVRASFDTEDKPHLMNIYSNYKIDFKLVGDFNYAIQIH